MGRRDKATHRDRETEEGEREGQRQRDEHGDRDGGREERRRERGDRRGTEGGRQTKKRRKELVCNYSQKDRQTDRDGTITRPHLPRLRK